MKDKILNWIGTGEVGLSSKAMALAVVDMPNDGSHPHDPDDLQRCLLLLDRVPEIRGYMHKVAAISDTWAKLVDQWDEIEQCLRDEMNKGNQAPQTYKLMKSIGC